MSVVTISRQYGSGGDEIANRVSAALGYRLFNKQMVDEAAHQAGIMVNQVLDISEDNYPVRTFLDRLFGSMATGAMIGFGGADGTFMLEADRMALDENSSFELVKRAVTGACDGGNLVVVGRGGQLLMRDEPCALHVRIEAPYEARVNRVKGLLSQSKESYLAKADLRKEAQSLIERRDHASAEYIKTFFHARWDDPTLYHVVINTGKISIDQAVQLILFMARDLKLVEPPSERTTPA